MLASMHALLLSYAAALTLSAAYTNAASSLSDLRGISPELQRRLTGISSFTCDSGAKKFDVARINDNYCDCADGSDEPGTSACSHTTAVFHCANAGFFSQDVPTSHVNDQICDCCDGSDEYASGIQCPVTCHSLMETFKAEKSAVIKSMEAGEADRKVIEAASADKWQEDQTKREALVASIASFNVMVEQQLAMKNNEEQIERDEKEHLVQTNKKELMKQLGLLDLSYDQLGLIILELANGIENKDTLLALIQRERDATSVQLETPLGKSAIEEEEEAFRTRDEERKRETERIEKLREDRRRDHEEKEHIRQEAEAAAKANEPDEEASSMPSVSVEVNYDDLPLPEVEERPVSILFGKLGAHQGHQRPEAVSAREKHQETTRKLLAEEEELRKLDAILNKSYGADRVLYSLRDQCYETKSGEYTYSICLYGQAKQTATRLGAMKDVAEDASEIDFTGGDKCWNGPERSLKVTLECGALPVELYAVDEPATCVYTAKLRTPIACDARNRVRMLSPHSNGAAPYKPHHVEVEVPAVL
uniref:Glucosidase 2 subunit beta n=1 Tax=Globisporangium ultimum (strain ATCC 200006 / CBS 805.95 / DAOM BR144) TaxID=431595 RepID=K3X3S3_GLOUD